MLKQVQHDIQDTRKKRRRLLRGGLARIRSFYRTSSVRHSSEFSVEWSRKNIASFRGQRPKNLFHLKYIKSSKRRLSLVFFYFFATRDSCSSRYFTQLQAARAPSAAAVITCLNGVLRTSPAAYTPSIEVWRLTSVSINPCAV